MKHHLNIVDLQDFLSQEYVTYSKHITKDGNKLELQVAIGQPIFKVIHNGEVIHLGSQPYPAILAYNDISVTL